MALANAADLSNRDVIEPLGLAELARRLFGASAALRRLARPDFARVHVEPRRKGMTLELLRAALLTRREPWYPQAASMARSRPSITSTGTWRGPAIVDEIYSIDA